MAQLKDSVVSGNLRVTDTTLTDTLQVTTIKAPTSSGGTTYGPGTSGQVLKSNGTSVYWTSDSNTDEKVKSTKLAQSTAEASYYPTLVTGAGTAGVSIFDSAKINHTPGTTLAVGNTRLILGNATNEGTADNEEGLLRIYSSGTKYHTLQFAKITNDHITHTFPTTGGTILNTGNYTSYTIPFAKVTGSADADTYAANTGWYDWNTTSGTNMPTENWGILLSKGYPSVQMFLPDTGNAIYLRKKTNASTAGSSWMSIRGSAGVDYNLASFVSSSTLNGYLPLSGGKMTGTIQGTYTNTHIALAGGGIGDYATLDNKNNINISSWNGVSISNGCSSVGTLDQVTFSVNARTGATQQRGNAILYSESGNSPALIFQRGTSSDDTIDWKLYVTEGHLNFDRNSSGTWTNLVQFEKTGKLYVSGTIYSNNTPVSLDGHDNKCTVTNGSTTSTDYGIVFAVHPNTTENNTLRKTNDFRYQMKDGAANTEGFATIVLGNTKKLSEANNKSGNIYLYSSGGNWHLINTTSTASNITHTLPATTGTILNSGTTSFTRTLSSGTKIGTIKINGTSTDLYCQTNTDENVLQSDTSSTSDFRPILLGTTHTTTVADLSATITGQAYVSSNIFVKPKTGIICAEEFSTLSYINGTGTHLEQYGLYLKSYKEAALPAGGNYSYKGYAVRTYDGKSANNGGMLLTMDGDGLTIIGSGSAVALADLISDDQQDSNTSRTRLNIGGTLNTAYHGSSEYLILSSNKNIVFLTNCSTIADRKPVVLDTALRFYPGTTETGSIGISSYQWNTIYGKTIYENGTSLASKYAAIGHTHNYAGSSSAGGPAASVATEVGNTAGARPVFYAYLGDNTRVVYNTNFTYNPSGNVLTATKFVGALQGNADTATILQTARNINGVSFDGSANITIPRSIKCIHTASGTEGSTGWVKIARITVTNLYANHPMTFTIAQRGLMQYRIHLVFVNNGSVAAAAISQFIIARDNSWTDTNNNPRAYIIKPSDGIFDLYIRKTEAYDHIFVVDFTKADNNEGDNYSVAWTNVHAADSAITGGTEAVKKLYLPTTTNYAGSSSAGGDATNANAANVTVTDVPSTSTSTDLWKTSYGILFAQNPNTTQSNTLRKSHNLRFYHGPNGTADTVGIGELIVGNNTASGTAGNMQGRLILYSSSSSYISMVPTATSSSVILTLPAVTGTVPSFTATPTSGQVVITDGTGGGIKSSGYTIAKSVPSNAKFTDENVKQSETTTNQYRPIVLGATYSTDTSTLAATITGQTYVSNLLYAQPEGGILYANRMYLKAPGSKGQLNLLTSKYNVMLRNDDSNTYFLVTAQNDPTGPWTSARPLTINNSTGICNINGTSSSWATARTLTLGGQLTGSVSVKGDANMTLNGYLDRAFIYDDNDVPDGHTWAEYAWHKFAEVTITGIYEDRVITFLVSRTHGSSAEHTGILSAKFRTNRSVSYDSAQLKWLVRNSGLSKDDFVMVYTSTYSTSTKVELWCRLPDQYHGLVFTVLKEHQRHHSTDTSWTLVKTPDGTGSTHGSSSYPTTGIDGTIISSDGTITNSTTGTATSANALNLAHSNEINFSKLSSTGHVWFGYRWNTQGTETSGGTTITTYKFGNANGSSGSTPGLAGLEAGTSTFKAGTFGDQLIVERTGGANMAGITFKNTSGVLGYIAANTVDGDLYHYGASDTSTMKYVILDSHNYTSYACGKVLFNTDTNSSDTISIVTANIPANTNHMTVIFKVSGSAAGVGKVYVASTIPYIRDVYLGGVLHVSTVSDDSGSVKLSLVPFTIQLTTSSTNTSVSLIHGTPVKIPGGTTPTERSGFDIKIVKIIGGA